MSTYTMLLYSVVGSAGCLTNGLAIFVLFHLPNWTSTTNLLILNQCIIDFLTSLLSLCLFLDPHLTTRLPESHFLAKVVCKIWASKYLFWLSIYTSTANLVTLTFDRYFAVIYPIKYNILKGQTRMKILILVIPWMCGCGVNLLWLSIQHVVDGVCIFTWPTDKYKHINGIVACVYIVVIPICSMFFAYVSIFRGLRKVGDGSVVSESTAARRMNIIKTLFTVSVVYVICVVPDQIAFTITSSGGDLQYDSPVYDITLPLALVNICINPIIYTCKYNAFKVGMKKALPCLFKQGNITSV
ncbi:galanin receptor 2b-like [Antedon mediterranea]|uniref:galanin receptor 2b-like n=1 Tax=Antedon mediterranea TaxID=105859 RepID=UPI003AF84D13